MTALSPHFALSEFTRTRAPLANVPTSAQIDNMVQLCTNVLEPWRAEVGRLYINSGFRSWEVNRWLREQGYHASPTSQHCQGEAADVRPLDMYLVDAWAHLVALVQRTAFPLAVDQGIFYVRGPGKGWIHVSHAAHTRAQRRQLLVDTGGPRAVRWEDYRGPMVLAE